MSTTDRDEEFEAFLARRSLLPRALAEQENAEPPPEVDRSVLYEAQAAAKEAPGGSSFRRSRWPVPLALAATVLISLAIVVQIQRPSSDALTASHKEERVMPREALEPARAPLERDLAEEPEPDIGALSDSPERFAKASAPAESRALIASANEMRVQEQRADESAADASTATTAQERREIFAASPPASAAANEDAAADTAVASRRRSAGAPPSSAPALADAAEADSGATGSSVGSAERGTADSVAAVEAENGKAAAPAAAASAERDPKAWLQRIAKLRADGKHAQADREFKAFVKRYPDYVTDEAAK